MNRSDQGLWNQLAESVVGRLAGALLRMVTAARSSSATAQMVNEGSVAWRRLPVSSRWQLIAMAIVSAVVTHVGLLWSRDPAGWLWLVIPGIAASFAVILLALSGSADRTGLSE